MKTLKRAEGASLDPGDLVRVPMGDLGIVLKRTNPTVYDRAAYQVYTMGNVVWFTQTKSSKSNLRLIQQEG